MKKYYEKQSSGRYSVDGKVTDWVKVQYNEARYGRSNGFPCGGNVCNNTWVLVQDAVNQWVADQKAAGRTTAEITAELKTFDQWDRYDFDGDGNFNEPDGYIDHFQIVHAGGDQADGDPQQGEDAIWSHRWYVRISGRWPGRQPGRRHPDRRHRPVGRRLHDPAGERRHQRLRPRVRPRPRSAGPVRHLRRGGRERRELVVDHGAEPGRQPTDGGIGERAADFGAWDKLQLGWLDYEIVKAGQNRTLELGPHEYNSEKAQGLVVDAAEEDGHHELGAAGGRQQVVVERPGNNLTNTMNRAGRPSPAGTAT